MTTVSPGRRHITNLAARQPWFVAHGRRIVVGMVMTMVVLLVVWKVAALRLRERLAHDAVEVTDSRGYGGGRSVDKVTPIPGAYFYLNLFCTEKYLIAEFKRTKDIDCFAAVLIRSGEPYTAEQFRDAFTAAGAVATDD